MSTHRALALLLALAAATGVAGAAPPPSAAAFGATEQVRNLSLAPSGRLLAWAEGDMPARIVLFDLDARRPVRTVQVDDALKVRDLEWCDDDILLVNASLTHEISDGGEDATYEFFRHLAIDRNTGQTRVLLMDGGARSWVTGTQLLSACDAKPGIVTMASMSFAAARYTQELGSRLVGGRRDDGWVNTIFEVDPRSGKTVPVAAGTPFTVDWLLAADGTPLARTEWQPQTQTLSIVGRNGDSWRVIHEQRGRTLAIAGRSPDGRAVLAVGSSDSGRSKLWSLPLDGAPASVVYEDPEHDVEAALIDPRDGSVVGARLSGIELRRELFPGPFAKREAALAKAFAGAAVRIGSSSADGRRVIAAVGSESQPETYYLVDFTTGRADIVGEAYPSLAGARLGQVREISYRARDGHPIPAYLVLPADLQVERLPMVVLPHGGPEDRDYPTFDYLAQFLASRGYAVLQPQFRGSTGFSEAHRRAGYRQWGRLMQDDVSDGVKAMVAQGIADPKRICIVGASYGGYAALAGAAFTPDLYACAASINGISDLPNMLGYSQEKGGKESNSLAYWKDHIGLAGDPAVIAASPARAVKGILAPVLLIHGEQDTVVPPGQAATMARELARYGKVHRLVWLPGEDHWLSKPATRTRTLEELERFLGEHLAAR